MDKTRRLPSWFHQPVPKASKLNRLKSSFDILGVHTVCESSRCPNLGCCWEKGTATFMILGDICSRACRFCAVDSGCPEPVDQYEPEAVARAVKELGLDYVVITSVTRDDLVDQGAEFFVRTINAVRLLNPKTKIEILIPDFFGKKEILSAVVSALPDVLAHNIETVKRLTPRLRPEADYGRSLSVLKMTRNSGLDVVIKSGLMLGLGETPEEIEATMKDLHVAGCDILTLGQYLAPSKTKRHVAVENYVTPVEFETYKQKALDIGFKYVLSGPLVRSSYLAKEAFEACQHVMGPCFSRKVCL